MKKKVSNKTKKKSFKIIGEKAENMLGKGQQNGGSCQKIEREEEGQDRKLHLIQSLPN